MIVINLFGGPGSGKSTVMAGLFYRLKRKHCNVELASEYAKDLVFSQTLDKIPQEFIFAEQHRRLQILKDNVDYAISDCPLILSHMYYLRTTDPAKNKNSAAFLDYVIATHKCYENFNVLLERPDVFTERGRVNTLEQSKEIDHQIVHLLSQHGFPFITLKTDENTVERIMSYYPFSCQ